MEKRIGVGLGVVIRKGNQLLMGKRKGAWLPDTWCVPGGHLEFGETFEECAAREVKEETGLEVANIKQGIVTNDIIEAEGRHYVSIIMVADYVDGEPQVMEPEKCEGWEWFSMDELPEKLCHPNECAFREFGFDPFSVK